MENYEKKYKEALEWMRDLYPSLEGSVKEDAEYFFPELKESKGERIKKAIMHILTENYTDAAVIEGVEIAEIVAWLEEQGKQLNPNDVIAWLRSYGCSVDSLVADFKKHFKI